MRNLIELWRKDNEEQYYGLSKDEVNTVLSRFEDSIDEIEELRNALEFYGEEKNWDLPSFGRGHSLVVVDRGRVARQLLGKEQTL